MSSVLVEYPEGLPAPTTGEVRPTERRAISSVGQMRNTRAIQRDRHGTRTVAFTFTPEQAAIFREWWVEWLQLGGGWFAANWPLPWSRGPNVFRFTDPPQWQLIGGRLDGKGYWQVRATCEIRGRGMLPTAEVMYLTSTPYPIEVFEEMGYLSTWTDRVRIDPIHMGSDDAMAYGPVSATVNARMMRHDAMFTEAVGYAQLQYAVAVRVPIKKIRIDEGVTYLAPVVDFKMRKALITYKIPSEAIELGELYFTVSKS